MKLREETQDAECYREVVLENEYGLPEQFPPDSVVVDIGAQVGCFAYAALERGAFMVVCVEPDPENFALLAANLAPQGIAWIDLHQAACWGSDPPPRGLRLAQAPFLVETAEGVVRATAMATCVMGAGAPVRCIALDELLAPYPEVELLKLDCEGAEWPILYGSALLGRCRHIVGELHPQLTNAFWPGGWDCTGEGARKLLEGLGFDVEVGPRPGRDPELLLSFHAARR
jgi:FkbM family methyltransferase